MRIFIREHRRATLSLVAALIAITLCGITYASDPYQFNCYAVAGSSLDHISTDVYVDPQMSTTQRVQLLHAIHAARLRVAHFFGPLDDDPIIIAGSIPRVYRVYGSAAGTTGATTLTPFKDYTILGPNGFNVDVISHELTHSELKARMGWSTFNLGTTIPLWFDEGLGMLNDERPKYSETNYQRLTDHGKDAPHLDSIASRVGFYNATTDQKISDQGVYINFMTAKHEVTRWYGVVGRPGLNKLIQDVKDGQSFNQSYKNIERAATKP